MEQPKQMLDDTITSVRRISQDLMPPTLEKFGLIQALKELCERSQATALLPVMFTEQGELRGLSPSSQLMIFRVAQELINNSMKHAKASTIKVFVHASDKLELIIEDDGIGFNAEAIRHYSQSVKGLGLFNIENRARLLSASLEFSPSQEKGSKIKLTMPL
jgi:signal transduction histidine kinase